MKQTLEEKMKEQHRQKHREGVRAKQRRKIGRWRCDLKSDSISWWLKLQPSTMAISM